MLIMNHDHYESVRRHGESTYPFECCGILVGRFQGQDRIVEEVIACANARDDRPQDRYHIDPKELVRVQRESARRSRDIVGFYHSHPDHPARWSQTDLAEAHWLNCSYVITSVEKGSATHTNSFVLAGESEEDKRLESEEISVLSAEKQ